MATSLLLKAPEQSSNHDEQNMTMKLLCGSCEETKSEPGRSSRGRKANGKGPKKQPQRGLGVAQLERLRIQESLKKMNEPCGLPTFPDHQHHHHLLQCHPSMLPFTVQDPFGSSSSSSSVPVRYGAAASNHVHGHGVFQCPQQVINGNTVAVLGQGPFIGNRSVLNAASGGVGAACGIGGGWLLPNQPNRAGSSGCGAPLCSTLVGSPLEISKELSSMPNVHFEPQCFNVCLKDNVKGLNARRDMPLEIWPEGPDFLGLIPQPATPNLVGETSDFCNKPSRHVAVGAYATNNLDESVEVVAVHRRGNSVSGRVFMEYEFFPVKDGRGTTSKKLALPTRGSVAVGGEASPITATAYGDTGSNSIDLSLKLSH